MMSRLITTIIALSAFMSLVAGNAEAASNQKNIEMCRAEIMVKFPTIENAKNIKFKSIRGSRLRQLTFDYKANNKRQKITCKIKRGKVVDIDIQ